MNRTSLLSRMIGALVLSLLLLSSGFGSAPAVGAVGCGPLLQLPASVQQSQERWRYTYEGGGSYEVVGWNPTEVTLFVNAPGCALSRMALVGLDLISGQQRWQVTADRWSGQANQGITTGSGLVIITTSDAIYAYDETTGQQLWTAGHDFTWAPEIVANENDVVVVAFDQNVMGLNEGTGAILWQQTLPTGSISDWQNIEGGLLVGLGRPDAAGQDVLAFGIDKSSGSLNWQTAVGSTISSTGGILQLAGNRSGSIAAEVLTDGTLSLVALDGATGAIRWSVPLADDTAFGQMFVTDGAQPAVIYALGSALDVKTATAYDAFNGTQRWQNQHIGADAILADDTHLVGAGPTLSYMNALVMVDGETGDMLWSQPYALVDGSFSGTAQIFNGEVIFAQTPRDAAAPFAMSADLATGNIIWSNSFPEFGSLHLDGVASGVVLVTGDTANEATMVALGS